MSEATEHLGKWLDSSGLQSRVRDMQDSLEGVDQRVRRFVEERPLTAVAIAACAGFLLGKLVVRLRSW